jgi:hypothetical protein
MSGGDLVWLPWVVALAALALAGAWWASRRGDAPAALRRLGYAIGVLGLWGLGVPTLLARLWSTLGGWVTRLVFNPLSWLGLVATVVAVLMILVGLAWARRRESSPQPEALRSRPAGRRDLVQQQRGRGDRGAAPQARHLVTVPPSGEQAEISHGAWRATITEVGATLRVLEHGARPLIRSFDVSKQASGGQGQVLLPWPNRVGDGAWHWRGHDLQLPLSEPARHNASHGLLRWVPWLLTTPAPYEVQADVRLRPQPGYPFALDVRITYSLGEGGLRVHTYVTNVGAEAAPYGHGMHPYLLASPNGRVDDWELTVPAATMLHVDERGLPTGTRRSRGRMSTSATAGASATPCWTRR